MRKECEDKRVNTNYSESQTKCSNCYRLHEVERKRERESKQASANGNASASGKKM